MLLPLRRIEYRWVILATAFLILFMGGGRLSIFGLVLKPMGEELAMSRSALSLVVTISAVVSAPALLVVGYLLDRHSLPLIMVVAATVSALALALMGLAVKPWQVFVLYGIVFPIANPGTGLLSIQVMISRWFDRRHGVANAAAQSGSSLGQLVIIGLLATFLGTLGWRAAFATLGIGYFLVVAPLILAAVRSRPPGAQLGPARGTAGTATSPAAPLAPLRSLAKSRPLWLLSLVYAICGFHDTFVTTHLVAFATDQRLSLVLAGNLLALTGILSFMGVLFSGILADAFGAVRVTLVCFVLRIGIFGFIIFFQNPFTIAAFALLFAFTLPITAPLVAVFVRNLFGQARLGLLSSFILMVHQVGGGLGALVGGVFFDTLGSYDWAFALMCLLAVLAAAATLLIRERPLAQVAARA